MDIVAHGGAVDGGRKDRAASLAACIGAGVRCAEVDVRMHRDGPVLAHDRPGRRARPDPLGPALDIASGLDWLMLDIKEPAVAVPAARAVALALDRVAAGAAQDPAAATAQERAAPADAIRFCSTSGEDLAAVRSVLPGAFVSLSFPDTGRAGIRSAWRAPLGRLYPLWRVLLPVLVVWWWLRLRPDMLTLDHRVVGPPGLWVARALGIPVIAWTVDDPSRARRLRRAGVAGITTNRPIAIRRHLEEEAAVRG
jgi:glycerophosphoryl diester phosphodiesterase